jgi:hypothetical protein
VYGTSNTSYTGVTPLRVEVTCSLRLLLGPGGRYWYRYNRVTTVGWTPLQKLPTSDRAQLSDSYHCYPDCYHCWCRCRCSYTTGRAAPVRSTDSYLIATTGDLTANLAPVCAGAAIRQDVLRVRSKKALRTL